MKLALVVLGSFVSTVMGLLCVRLYDPTQLQPIACFAGMGALAGLFILGDVHVDHVFERDAAARQKDASVGALPT